WWQHRGGSSPFLGTKGNTVLPPQRSAHARAAVFKEMGSPAAESGWGMQHRGGSSPFLGS
ncbi:MAG: hypothetical protein WB757_08565, partial [Candidatus Cybelea sp.]